MGGFALQLLLVLLLLLKILFPLAESIFKQFKIDFCLEVSGVEVLCEEGLVELELRHLTPVQSFGHVALWRRLDV